MSRRKRSTRSTSELIKIELSPASTVEREIDAIDERGGRAKRLLTLASGTVLGLVLVLGIFANNGWLPHTDALSGRKTGWFGKSLPQNATSTWNFLLPTATPQLSREYIRTPSGRLIAVEDANANAVAPADLAVWRSTDGTWYVSPSSGSNWGGAWGTAGDIPTPGDFDGDGKTDLCIFRPDNANGTGTWYIVNSSTQGAQGATFGANTDKPAPADFDGDGKSDLAVFRPSNGTWYVYQSSNQQTMIYPQGQSGDLVAPADYDGDGKADAAVYRPTTGQFFALKSSTSQSETVSLGSSTSVPVSGDYDGDGKADYAVQTGNTWTIRYSTNPGTPANITWQTAGWKAVPADYDGDGKCDIAVWDNALGIPSGNAYWYIRNSKDLTTRTAAWGTKDDFPVPSTYRR